ncbi:MAG TPA: hypothetical protein VLT10_00120, partial [Verrucomicrobiae bacterium]|nr:hypothetical protein [Verrucomicrobiae bacterium]
ESLPSKDKGNLYNLVRNYVNAGTAPQPFDASVDLTSGDGSTILSWKYSKCDITKYQPYFQSYLIVNTITEKFQPEIHEKIFFQCAGLALSGSKQSTNSKSSVQPINFVPNDSDRALYNVVKFSGGEVPTMRPFYTFAAFNPDMSASDIKTASFPQIKSKSFTLESLPSKDKADYYKFLSRYVNPTSKPEPFDATIELVAGDGTVLQTWQYQKCQATDYKTYLQSSLLFYTFSGNKASSETQDQTTFQCSGFTIQFGGTNKDLSSQQITPTSDDRVMAYVAHITSAEFTGTMSTGLVQDFDTLGNRKIQLESLASKYSSNEPFYLLSKYINPGVAPELFGVTSDLVTGDGTKLFSIKYGKCSALDYSTSLEYNIVNIKYATPIKPEIRTNGILQCSGVGADILPPVKPTDLIGPIVQKAIGISSDKIACNEGFEPMVRPPNNNVICAKNTSVSTLTQRGWEVATTSHHNLSNDIKPIIPTLDQRAASYVVKFQGADISTQTLDTFSNFEPTSTNSYTNPSGSFSGTASFNLQSLPSKDKKDLYKLISKYINPGTKPEPFDVTVYVIGGDGTTLQTWSYGKCQVSNYNPYLDENLLLYKFHLNWQSEIKEETSFSCSGLGVKS